jgi:hypothetical protein
LDSRRNELSAHASEIVKAHRPRGVYREPKSVDAMRRLLTNPALQEPPRVIYVIGADAGAVKVGLATDVDDRLKTLQTGCPDKLRVYGVARVAAIYARAVERQCHKALAKYHRHGEWFDVPATEAVDLVREIAERQRYSLGDTRVYPKTAGLCD